MGRKYFYFKTNEGFIEVERLGRKYQFCHYQGRDNVPCTSKGAKKEMIKLAVKAMQDYVLA